MIYRFRAIIIHFHIIGIDKADSYIDSVDIVCRLFTLHMYCAVTVLTPRRAVVQSLESCSPGYPPHCQCAYSSTDEALQDQAFTWS